MRSSIVLMITGLSLMIAPSTASACAMRMRTDLVAQKAKDKPGTVLDLMMQEIDQASKVVVNTATIAAKKIAPVGTITTTTKPAPAPAPPTTPQS